MTTPTPESIPADSLHPGIPKPKVNPYLRAREEYMERYGHSITLAQRFFILSCLSVGAVTALAVACIYLSTKAHVVPYVVEIDRAGVAQNIRAAEQVQPADQRVVISVLERAIVNLRSVSPDRAIQAQRLRELNSLLGAGPARGAVMRYLQKFDPWERAKKELCTVEISVALPITKETMRIEWTETVIDRGNKGQILRKNTFEASIQYAVRDKDDGKAFDLFNNPLGIVIHDINMTEKSTATLQ